MATILTLDSARTKIAINRRGGELWSIVHDGRERLWHGDPGFWNYRAPILFPVVGRSRDEQVEVDGERYPMPLHGFARDIDFAVLAQTATTLSLEQHASPVTKELYPFDYAIRMEFALAGDTLTQTTTIENRSPRPMPFCFGYHPGFLWPWDGKSPREAHIVRFDQPEPDPIRRARMQTGLVIEGGEASPLIGRDLHVGDHLFIAGALQFPAQRSRGVWFGVPGQPGLRVGFPDSPQLGIWTRVGAPYLCIEPWQGLAAEETGPYDLAARPGARILAPGEQAPYRLELTFGAAEPAA